jgi:CheY-like chemotaxis protein
MSYRVLLVQPDPNDGVVARDTLEGAGYTLQVVGAFEDAIKAMAENPPDLLISSLRLGKFNGLHLVLRSRTLYPSLPSLVFSVPADRSVDVDRLDVRFLPTPIEPHPLLSAVADLLADRSPRASESQRRWPRKHAHIPATIFESSVEVVELSYGGLRLEGIVPAAGIGTPIAITFPTLGLSVTAVARWTKPVLGAASWCGAEITDAGWDATARWRGVVDSQN